MKDIALVAALFVYGLAVCAVFVAVIGVSAMAIIPIGFSALVWFVIKGAGNEHVGTDLE